MDKVSFDHSFVQRTRIHHYVGKRWLDIIGSLAFIILLSPVLLAVGVMILIFSGRPIIYRQVRAGLNGNPFTIWKFRTMNHGVNGSKQSYNWQKGVPDDFIFKTPHDQNITRIGKFLRRYSLDELPQFFNVLIGNMSLIGPRPEIVEITSCYDPIQSKRLLVKPGITGYAQINGRSLINHGRKMELDHYYVDHCSFYLDLKILIFTVFLVLKGKGAF